MTIGASPPRSVTVRVGAKVNCELKVGPRRADGFHELSTVFMAVGLYDEVTVSQAETWEVATTGPYATDVPAGIDNLALRAARLLARHAQVTDPQVRIRIDKDIPVAGGLAGGSADAAAALLACDHLWGLRLEREELSELAAELGSDVPFVLAGGVAIGSGRGERLAPVLAQGTFHWVLATSTEGLATADVYAEYDRLDQASESLTPTAELMTALRGGDAEALAAVLSNDLQDAAVSLRPELATVLSAGLDFGALGGIVSGSGPTVAFLTRSSEHALDLCVALAASGVAPETKRARGPVSGAHVVATPTRD
ncbi:MAG: 4-(cytidine 5'-diphospho)-2-C-methyl-D-erythritol kinase [Actinomycetales bacterium]|nr:MAG: 4-(cytidine 5'-diphospho)-2-C-methyl-D-erythritol kinase [Actinomycetales bacterium]